MALGAVRAVRELAGLDMEFSACIAQAEHEADKGGERARRSLELLRKWNVECVYWDGLGAKLGEMRRTLVLPQEAAAPG